MENREQVHPNKNKKYPKQDQSNFERSDKNEFDEEEEEINPSKLDREELEPDRTGSENTKGHQPYELSRGSNNNRGVSGAADGVQFGARANSQDTQGRRNRIAKGGKLLGQGGYGTQGQGSDGGVDGIRSGRGSGEIKKAHR